MGDSPSRPDFVDNTWTASEGSQETRDITYPFNPSEEMHLDLETLHAAAQSGENGNRFGRRSPGDTGFRIEDYPANSTLNTVYFVGFSNAGGSFTTTPGGSMVANKGSLQYSSDVANPKGIIVVVNGTFRGSPSAKTFTGNLIMRDPVDNDLEQFNGGNFDLRGFVNVEGTIIIRGHADSATPTAVIISRHPGTYRMDLWSYR